jgi:hypothetical protein
MFRSDQPYRRFFSSRNNCSMVIRRPYSSVNFCTDQGRSVIKNQHSSRLFGSPFFQQTATCCTSG